MIADFFGPSNRQLLGVNYPPRGDVGDRAVLICPPIGQEYVRTYWALGLLCNQLARKNIYAMRLDYRGHGDSFGKTHDVNSIEDWKLDIESAIQKLKADSGCRSVMLVGLRFGASLAAEVAAENYDVNSLVAWEPVFRGDQYLAELRLIHKNMLDLWYKPVSTIKDPDHEELLGSLYTSTLLSEIALWRLELDSLLVPQLVLSREERAPDNRPAWQRNLVIDDEDSWKKLVELEVAWLRPHTTQQVVAGIVDMFDRLDLNELLGNSRDTLIGAES
ncbi:MAG TPA: hypothetical protein DDW52_11990 [Planctomycetaceae bacterium]|nr:hypothetical protein [Planctomycetaceae bacterium]